MNKERGYRLIDYWNNKIKLTAAQKSDFSTPTPAEMNEWHREILVRFESGTLEVKDIKIDPKQTSRYVAQFYINGAHVDEVLIWNTDGKVTFQIPFCTIVCLT